MSMDITTAISERVCYVHCTFCNTILAVSVPSCSMYTAVTVRCGHCANLLSVNIGPSSPFVPPEIQDHNIQEAVSKGISGSSSSTTAELNGQQPRLPPIRPPEKRQRVPSAYNKFIKEEIQRIKANNPEISHREAFSAAAKNWAHFPHIHFGLNMEGQMQAARVDQAVSTEATNRSHAFSFPATLH